MSNDDVKNENVGSSSSADENAETKADEKVEQEETAGIDKSDELTSKIKDILAAPPVEEGSSKKVKEPKKKEKKKRSIFFKIIAATIFVVVFFSLAGAVGFGYYIHKLSLDLPTAKEFAEFKYSEPMVVYDRNGEIIAELGSERRYPLSLDEIPKAVKDAVIAVEDARFYEHGAIDFQGITRAFFRNISTGRMSEGGSTLTQQLVKVIYLSPERKLKRKLKEMIIAYRLEAELTKDQILELYLNQVNFGRGAYGIKAAAMHYFGKEVNELTLAEAAMIAGIPKGPSRYAPHISLDRAVTRRNHVLNRMLETGYITRQEYEKATSEHVKLVASIPLKLKYAGYFMDFVKKYIEEELKIENPTENGIKVYTTLDIKLQIAAEKALASSLLEVAKKERYVGPIGSNVSDNASLSVATVELDDDIPSYLREQGYKKALVTKVAKNEAEVKLFDGNEGKLLYDDTNSWAIRKKAEGFTTIIKVDDIIYVKLLNEKKKLYSIEQDPILEAALVSVHPRTGELYTMVGGLSYNKSFFNRTVQAKRQMGSTFKPFVYATAYENGYMPMDVFIDNPIIQAKSDDNDEMWRPKNYDGTFRGELTLERALELSNNSVTVQLAQRVGLNKILQQVRKFGFEGEFQRDLSVALGSGVASPLEVAYAYTTFANMGKRPAKPYFITKILDIDNKVIYEMKQPELIDVLSPRGAALIGENLINVVERGGSYKARLAIPRIMMGKTGTSNESRDGWFAGSLPNLTTVAWVGYDDSSPMRAAAVGANTAQVLWINYMKQVYKYFPIELFEAGSNVIFQKVDKNTFNVTDAISSDIRFEIFPEDDNGKIMLPRTVLAKEKR